MKLAALAFATLLTALPAHANDPVSRQCLANVIYREARGESLEGQRAVAHVVLNRVKDPAFPDTICEVVRQPGQFARKRPGKAVESTSYERAKVVAGNAIRGLSGDPTGGATYFTTRRVSNAWTRRMVVTELIGAHKFMRRRK